MIKMNKTYKLIERVFNVGFNAGRLYTFENKEVTPEKLDVDTIKTFHAYYTMKDDDGKSWHDRLEELSIK